MCKGIHIKDISTLFLIVHIASTGKMILGTVSINNIGILTSVSYKELPIKGKMYKAIFKSDENDIYYGGKVHEYYQSSSFKTFSTKASFIMTTDRFNNCLEEINLSPNIKMLSAISFS